MRQLFRRGRSKIGARLFSILSMQSRKTKKKERGRPSKKRCRSGGEEGEKGRGVRIFIVWHNLGGKTLWKWNSDFFWIFRLMFRAKVELGLADLLLHYNWLKPCLGPNRLSMIGWAGCLAGFGLVGGFSFIFYSFQYYIDVYVACCIEPIRRSYGHLDMMWRNTICMLWLSPRVPHISCAYPEIV